MLEHDESEINNILKKQGFSDEDILRSRTAGFESQLVSDARYMRPGLLGAPTTDRFDSRYFLKPRLNEDLEFPRLGKNPLTFNPRRFLIGILSGDFWRVPSHPELDRLLVYYPNMNSKQVESKVVFTMTLDEAIETAGICLEAIELKKDSLEHITSMYTSYSMIGWDQFKLYDTSACYIKNELVERRLKASRLLEDGNVSRRQTAWWRFWE